MIKTLQYSSRVVNPFFQNVLLKIRAEAKKNPLMEQKILRRMDRIDSMRIKDSPMKQIQVDLNKNYLHGFMEEDFGNCNPIIKRAFEMTHATPTQLLKFKKQHALKKYQDHPLDTSSLKVQAACVCEETLHFLSHLEGNRADFKGYRKFQELLAKRNRILG